MPPSTTGVPTGADTRTTRSRSARNVSSAPGGEVGPKSVATPPGSPATSAGWPPWRSRIVSRSSGRRATVVVPPGRTR